MAPMRKGNKICFARYTGARASRRRESLCCHD